jgi:hypothetical protein
MKKRVHFLLLFCFWLTAGYSQIQISGNVLQSSGEAIPYVNIGIKNKNTGTVSTETGAFSLQLKPENSTDTLTFSCIGYEALHLPIQQIINEKRNQFYLNPKITELKEVVLGNKLRKHKTVGTKSVNPLFWGSATSKDGKDIIEMCKRFDLKSSAEIEKLHVYLKGVTTRSVTFRIHFYEVKDDMPGERLTETLILCKKDIDNGWLEIDLTSWDLVMEDAFFVSIEFLPLQQAKGYSFSYGGQVGGSVYTRESSLGAWKKNSGVTMSLYLTVKQ